MSWDAELTFDIDTGTKHSICVAYLGGQTYNVAPMYFHAFGEGINGVRGLNGKLAGDCIPLLQHAIQVMKDDSKLMRDMNPENGWGNYEGALKWLEKMLGACLEHPKTTMRIM